MKLRDSLTLLLLTALAAPAAADEIALDDARVAEGSEEAVVEHVPWSGTWWPFNSGQLAQGYHDGQNFTYDDVAQLFSEAPITEPTLLSPLRKYDLFVERREGTNPRSAWLELQGDDAKDFHHHMHGDRKRDLDARGVSYGWWGHCNGWSAAAVMEREPVAPIVAEGIRFEVGDLKGLLSESHWGVRSDFTGTRYSESTPEMRQRVARGKELLDKLGTNAEPPVADYIAWYEEIFARTLDAAVKPTLTPASFKRSLESVRDWAKRTWDDAFADLAPQVFHQLLVTQIKNKRSAFVMDTSADEEVWNFPAYAYRTTLRKVEDLPGGGKRYAVETRVSYASDGVSESILGVNEVAMDYTYTLDADADGRLTGGAWTGDSVDEHPDFAWLPTLNPEGEDRGENPRLLYGKLLQILQTDHAHGARQLELEVRATDGGVVRQGERIRAHETSTWNDPVAVANPVTLRVRRAGAGTAIAKVVYALGRVRQGSIATVERGEVTVLGEVTAGNALEAAYTLPAGKQQVVAHGYDAAGRLIAISELAVTVGGQTPPPPAQSDDAYEQNDDRASAKPLPAGEYPNLQCRDDDWFKVDVPANGRLRVELRFSHAEGDLDLDVQGVGNSAGTADTEAVERAGLAAGAYYVRVFGYGGAKAAYALRIVVEGGAAPPPPPPASNDDAFEENDTAAAAAALVPGVHAIQVRDDDWFAVQLAAGQRATVSLSFRHADGDLDLAAHGPDGARLSASESTSDREEVSVTATTAGRYTFRAYGYDGAMGRADLELRVTGSTPPPPPASTDDAFEANDTRAAATAVTRGDYPNLRAAGNDDWYKVTLAANQTVVLRVRFSHAEGDLDVSLHDAAGARLSQSAGTTDVEEVRYTATAATTVYLRVYGYSGARAAYSLKVE